jgi:hypothetical protein
MGWGWRLKARYLLRYFLMLRYKPVLLTTA